jgi:undecaprenyl-diphosphatase
MLAAFVSGMLAIGFLLRYLRTRSLNVFVAYRLILAAIVVVVWLR